MEPSNFSPYRPNNNNHPSTSKRPQQPLFIPPGQVAFRIICHASRVGGLIGKSGAIIKNIQQGTNTKIRVDEPPNSASADYRVISVIGSPVVATKVKVSVAVGVGVGVSEGKEDGGVVEGENESWFDVSAAQDGVLRVFERVVEVAAEGDAEATIGGVVSLRILAGKSQVGAVIGKGGMIVERIRRDTGCRIKVLISEKLPSGPFPNEEIVEIEGDVLGVKKALLGVTGRLQEFPPPPERSRVNLSRPPDAESLHVHNIDLMLPSGPVLKPTSNTINSYGNGPSTLNYETKSNTDITKRRQEVVFKILCPSDRIGCIIGKGGSIVKSIQLESGAYINIGPVVAECNERLITIHAMENVESQYSPVQKAAVLVFSRFIESSAVTSLDSDLKGSPVLAKVVVPENQVGCLLGKGGSIISEMRKATNTGLKIFADNLPKCASENVEILQITGELANVRDAIHRVVGRLRGYILMPQMSNGGINRDALRTDNSPYSRKDTPAPVVSPVILDNVNEHESLTQRMDHLGISNNIDQSPGHNLQAAIPDAGANTGNAMDCGRRMPPNNAGTELGRSAIVMNTTVEISVPENVIGSIYGDNGSNLVRLRQISGAKVTVNEPLPGTTDRMVIISGSPDETQVAQSLLQAFLLSGSG